MTYVPDRGNIVKINFDPQAGREQFGRRPALVISPKTYNDKVGWALFCPITKQSKGYPFEVELHGGPHRTEGVVLSDHVKSLDWKIRRTQFVEKATMAVISKVQKNIQKLLVE